MPKGPKGEKRPAHVIANAVRVMQIATGEAEEDYEGQTDDGKDFMEPVAKRFPRGAPSRHSFDMNSLGSASL